MIAAALHTRSFRNLTDGEVALGAGLTVVHGANGAGKTNLLEALFFALTGRSCRTRREREMIRFGDDLARSEVTLQPSGEQGESADPFTMLSSVSASEGRRRRIEGRDVTPEDDRRRPAVSVFMPSRLALVTGPPAPRRAHLDRLAAALWPARSEARSAYGRALAQRNALLGRVRAGGNPAALEAWDRELALTAVPLVEARAAAAEALAGPFAETARLLGLEGGAKLEYRPRAAAAEANAIEAELRARRPGDLARGFTGWGPHRDEVELIRADRSVRRYGSQGQQRVTLLALLFAEREALQKARRALPLLLLDDVMSELDPERRRRLVGLLDEGGQALITATESAHVPDGEQHRRIKMESGDAASASGRGGIGGASAQE